MTSKPPSTSAVEPLYDAEQKRHQIIVELCRKLSEEILKKKYERQKR